MAEQGYVALGRNGENLYATCQDFLRIFDDDMHGLYQLSHLLTADHEKAERCFVTGMEDCAKENRVFREWAHTWARRVIVQNAIRELQPRPGHSCSSARLSTPFSHKDDPIERFQVDAVLELPDFERFVFVLCVLERFREHDCALLLSCSTASVREARNHAMQELANARPSVLELHRDRKRGGWAAALKA